MKIALLTYFIYLEGEKKGIDGYIWTTTNEKNISREFKTADEALNNKPKEYDKFIQL